MFGSACEGATKLAEHVWPVYPAQRSSLDAKSAPRPMQPAREGLGLVTLTGAIWVEVWRCKSGLWGSASERQRSELRMLFLLAAGD
jgi:hypothetical protein